MPKKTKRKDVKKLASEIMEIVTSKKDKSKDKKSKDKSKDKAKTKKSSFTTKQVKEVWKDLSLPKMLTTREATLLIEEISNSSLGLDTTAGAKNLRRRLRSLDRYNDNETTHYRWHKDDAEDLDELVSLCEYYSKVKQAK